MTPITKAELVFGLNGAGAIKAVMTGVVITVIGSLLAGVGTIFHPATMLGLIVDDRADVGGIQFDDVLVDGAGRGPAGAAGDVWDSEYAAVFSQRIDLSGSKRFRRGCGRLRKWIRLRMRCMDSSRCC